MYICSVILLSISITLIKKFGESSEILVYQVSSKSRSSSNNNNRIGSVLHVCPENQVVMKCIIGERSEPTYWSEQATFYDRMSAQC